MCIPKQRRQFIYQCSCCFIWLFFYVCQCRSWRSEPNDVDIDGLSATLWCQLIRRCYQPTIRSVRAGEDAVTYGYCLLLWRSKLTTINRWLCSLILERHHYWIHDNSWRVCRLWRQTILTTGMNKRAASMLKHRLPCHEARAWKKKWKKGKRRRERERRSTDSSGCA